MPVRTALADHLVEPIVINDLEVGCSAGRQFTPRCLTAKLFIAEKLKDAGTAAP